MRKKKIKESLWRPKLDVLIDGGVFTHNVTMVSNFSPSIIEEVKIAN